MGDDVRLAHDVRIFGVHVEKVCFVRRRVAVAHRIAHHGGDEAVGHGVNAARPDTAAGGKARQDRVVDAEARQRRGERRAEEGARILLRDHELVFPRLKSLGPGAERAAFAEMAQGQGLFIKAAAVDGLRVIELAGEDHGDSRFMRRFADAEGGRQRVLDARIEIAFGIEIGLYEIDENEGRALAEAHGIAVGAFVVFFEIGHLTNPRKARACPSPACVRNPRWPRCPGPGSGRCRPSHGEAPRGSTGRCRTIRWRHRPW